MSGALKMDKDRQPDLALVLELEKEPFLIVVEAKYLSGTSDYPPEEQAEDTPPTDHPADTGNQLAEQMKSLAKLSDNDIRKMMDCDEELPPIKRIAHLFVTANYSLPTTVYRKTWQALSGQRLDNPRPIIVCWLSWTSLPQYLKAHLSETDPGRKALVEDLLALLKRKRLVPFSGFSQIPWRLPGRPFFWMSWKLAPMPQLGEPYFWTWWNLKPFPQLGEPYFWKGGEGWEISAKM
jgi:hypothetical protein